MADLKGSARSTEVGASNPGGVHALALGSTKVGTYWMPSR